MYLRTTGLIAGIILLSVLLISCNGGSSAPVPVPPALADCFPADVNFTGTYVAIIGISPELDVNRSAKINGQVFAVDETGDDGITEINNVDKWKAKIKRAGMTPSDTSCFDLEYKSEPFGSDDSVLEVTGTVCKTDTGCVVSSSAWSIKNKDGRLHGSGTWNFR